MSWFSFSSVASTETGVSEKWSLRARGGTDPPMTRPGANHLQVHQPDLRSGTRPPESCDRFESARCSTLAFSAANPFALHAMGTTRRKPMESTKPERRTESRDKIHGELASSAGIRHYPMAGFVTIRRGSPQLIKVRHSSSSDNALRLQSKPFDGIQYRKPGFGVPGAGTRCSLQSFGINRRGNSASTRIGPASGGHGSGKHKW